MAGLLAAELSGPRQQAERRSLQRDEKLVAVFVLLDNASSGIEKALQPP